ELELALPQRRQAPLELVDGDAALGQHRLDVVASVTAPEPAVAQRRMGKLLRRWHFRLRCDRSRIVACGGRATGKAPEDAHHRSRINRGCADRRRSSPQKVAPPTTPSGTPA